MLPMSPLRREFNKAFNSRRKTKLIRQNHPGRGQKQREAKDLLEYHAGLAIRPPGTQNPPSKKAEQFMITDRGSIEYSRDMHDKLLRFRLGVRSTHWFITSLPAWIWKSIGDSIPARFSTSKEDILIERASCPKE